MNLKYFWISIQIGDCLYFFYWNELNDYWMEYWINCFFFFVKMSMWLHFRMDSINKSTLKSESEYIFSFFWVKPLSSSCIKVCEHMSFVWTTLKIRERQDDDGFLSITSLQTQCADLSSSMRCFSDVAGVFEDYDAYAFIVVCSRKANSTMYDRVYEGTYIHRPRRVHSKWQVLVRSQKRSKRMSVASAVCDAHSSPCVSIV